MVPEGRREALRVGFDGGLKLAFHGSRITSDAGLLAYRELNEVLGLTAMGDALLEDHRIGNNRQHTLTAQRRRRSSAVWRATSKKQER